ncbi:MAG: L,D-transpeptidase family protein [Bacteroidales bacterium]|nr:L,D-transpeptidase family protein [Bacteroidales bacterium]
MNEILNTDHPENTGRSFADSELVQMISGIVRAVAHNRIIRKTAAITFRIFATLISLIAFAGFFLYLVPALQDAGRKASYTSPVLKNYNYIKAHKREIAKLNNEIRNLSGNYQSYTPYSYLVINTTENKFRLYQNRKMVREGYCSSGSYIRLVTPEGSREWVFKTPKGRFTIQQKIVKPLWVKPDWAFIEEGLPVPPANDESRYEWGVLGDYAMSLGDGYLIHGTLYERYMGMPVTHGCVRLNDEDLEAVFNSLTVGSRVYIF